MNWWGKLAGGAFGFMLGGPLGALLGAAFGHSFDKGLAALPEQGTWQPGDQERIQTAFFTATFSVMGHIAKVDGKVSKDEISLAKAVMADMDLPPPMRQTAIHLFNEGKEEDFPLLDVLGQCRKECHRRHTLIQMFIEIQLQAAFADGEMHKAEERLLLQICDYLGIPQFVFRRLVQMAQAEQRFTATGGRRQADTKVKPNLNDAYAILNISPDVSNAEAKKAYRRLLNQHHPDKLVAKGLPEEMMRMATQKTHEIRQAYEQIKESRGMR